MAHTLQTQSCPRGWLVYPQRVPSLGGCGETSAASGAGERMMLTFHLRGRRPLDTQVQGVQTNLHVGRGVSCCRLLCTS